MTPRVNPIFYVYDNRRDIACGMVIVIGDALFDQVLGTLDPSGDIVLFVTLAPFILY